MIAHLRSAIAFTLLFFASALSAQTLPQISIIIDDLGDRLDEGNRAIELDGDLTYAILPHTPFSKRLAEFANCLDKEVMLHMPMQALSTAPLGPGGLTIDMNEMEFREMVRSNLNSVPYVAGVNNHMGSLLTRHPGHMMWLMDELRERGNLFYIDSRTTTESTGPMLASETGIPFAERKVFLDHDRSPDKIRYQFNRLIRSARIDGHAIGIGHPYAETLTILEELLPQLSEMGVELVPISSLLKTSRETNKTWQASLSH